MDTTITAAPIGSLRQRMLQDVLSVEEAARLNEAAPGIKYKAIFSVAYGAGLRVSEVTYLKVGDIDSERMIIRVLQGKGRKDRMPCPHRTCWICCGNGGAKANAAE
ncbi:phage integrase family protein [Novosphingobium sp. PhB57]|uniref:tyrosine-type recombinase/integrase n=1 Tax=Novosphingobium sp. PhB57 TaxID=2485107 RepID=UPI0010D07B1E|nr:tyrosine-type recombinase/integrase [Novosphingobium sp. PhB57]TCU54622.1 phage integrase family protein [Novosphingobium sp. PhB57]